MNVAAMEGAMPMTDSIPNVHAYASTRVFNGKRPLSPDRAAKLKARYQAPPRGDTSSRGYETKPGDSLRFRTSAPTLSGVGMSNRYRHRVVAIESETEMQFQTFRRPSRGFARHIRRQKASRL